MCGIAGIRTTSPTLAPRVREIAESMSACIVHRGPDDEGAWAAAEAGVAFGFRRLSIIDLSPAGHQPMQSASGRFTVVFNGEAYNYVEVRAELEGRGCRFRGDSDTEVILHAFEQWGIESGIRRFIGMFAIAVWDAEERRLSLIRDRLGVKPLFYTTQPGLLLFGSELKSIAAVPEFDRTLDEDAVSAYLRYLYVPAPLTIYRHARKLLPGHILSVGPVPGAALTSVPYWSVDEAYRLARANPFDGTDAEAVAELRRLLSDSVRLRMRSDVPMGALLSGGIDSSTVVALMQQHAAAPVRTFSIGFPGTEHDESDAAAGVAHALGTDHTPLAVTGEEALATIPQLPDIFDEPLADPSQLPTYLVCRLARQHVTVALTGDGGDEVFAGYERYIQGERLIRMIDRLPRAAALLAGSVLTGPSTAAWDIAYRIAAPVFDPARRHRLAGQKMLKLGGLLRETTPSSMYESLLAVGWRDPSRIMTHPALSRTRVEELLDRYADRPLLDRMMLTDQQVYLADDLLAKVDRASMAVSLEAREPLLDHRLIEFSWRLDRRFKIRDGRGKWVLKEVLYSLVDRSLVDRPKTGFTVPIAAWLRGPLRHWAEELLLDRRMTAPWLSNAAAESAWSAFLRGRDELALGLWALVMLHAWRARWAP
jgi:asparagine synthase (glutamine-hydrolysing)